MKRLTKTVNGVVTYIGAGNEFDTGALPAELSSGQIRAVMNRLAAYEDSGLEPEEIADFMKRWEQAVEIGGMLKKYGIDHIWDIIRAEKDGRLVVLPCKVGDHILADGREAIVVWFFGYKTGRYLHAQFLDNAECADIPFYEIGKNRLPDPREEADDAMKEANHA